MTSLPARPSNELVTISVLILVCMLLSACASTSTKPVLNHVVLLWLKPQTSTELRHRIITRTRQLASLPMIQSLQLGTPPTATRTIVDDSFDIGIIMQFNSASDMQAYLTHPAHRQLVGELIKPNIDRIVIYDF